MLGLAMPGGLWWTGERLYFLRAQNDKGIKQSSRRSAKRAKSGVGGEPRGTNTELFGADSNEVAVGDDDGDAVGGDDGDAVGRNDGDAVGRDDGDTVGRDDGGDEGTGAD